MSREARRITYDVSEVGEILGIGRNAAYEGVARGDIPSVKIGKRILVPVAALQRMLDGADAPPIAGAVPILPPVAAPTAAPAPAPSKPPRNPRPPGSGA